MKQLTAEQILQAPRAKPVPVEVPEWGGIVHVRMLTAGELDQFQMQVSDQPKDSRQVRGLLVAVCCCDEQGYPLFTEAQVEQLAALDCAPMERVFEAAQKLNGLARSAQDDARKN